MSLREMLSDYWYAFQQEFLRLHVVKHADWTPDRRGNVLILLDTEGSHDDAEQQSKQD